MSRLDRFLVDESLIERWGLVGQKIWERGTFQIIFRFGSLAIRKIRDLTLLWLITCGLKIKCFCHLWNKSIESRGLKVEEIMF